MKWCDMFRLIKNASHKKRKYKHEVWSYICVMICTTAASILSTISNVITIKTVEPTLMKWNKSINVIRYTDHHNQHKHYLLVPQPELQTCKAETLKKDLIINNTRLLSYIKHIKQKLHSRCLRLFKHPQRLTF